MKKPAMLSVEVSVFSDGWEIAELYVRRSSFAGRCVPTACVYHVERSSLIPWPPAWILLSLIVGECRRPNQVDQEHGG